MAEAIGTNTFGNMGCTAENCSTIIYNALVNGIGKVITLLSFKNQNALNHIGYNLMYYICSGSYTSPDAVAYGTTYGWIYNMSSFSVGSKIEIGAGYFNAASTSVLTFECYTYAHASVTCLLLNV